jgi:effector-binding domain-containing protein
VSRGYSGRVRDYLVEIATVAPRPTAVVRETTTWEEFPRLWGQLLDEVYAYVRQRPELATGVAPGELWQNVMLYGDDVPTVEVGVLASAPFAGEGRVVASQLPGGPVARTVQRGDYAALGDAHDAVQRFAAERGLERAGPRWEIYGHAREDPAEGELEIYYLLAIASPPPAPAR